MNTPRIIIVFLALAFSSASVMAQEDSVNVKIGGGSVSVGVNDEGTEYVEIDFDNVVSNRKVKTKWGLLDIGINVPVDDNFTTPGDSAGFGELRYGRSWNIDMHLFKQRVSLVKNKFNLDYGLTFSWNNYSFQNDVVPQPNQPTYTLAAADEPLKKSRMSSTYITIPVLFNYESNPNARSKSFRLSAGVTGGLRIASKTKFKTESKSKTKQKDDFNLNQWQYGPTVRVGYSFLEFYGKYDMAGFFKEGEGPAVQNFTVGLAVRPY